jgi:hypothetical protein
MKKTVINMTRILLLLCVLVPSAVFSQIHINKTRAEVREQMKQYNTGSDSVKLTLRETPTTLEYAMRSPEEVISVDFIYSFDKTGKCDMEKLIVYCDSCLAKYMQPVLDKKEYKWIKLNENQYVSEFARKLLLEIPLGDSDRSFIILRADWTQKQYELMTGN